MSLPRQPLVVRMFDWIPVGCALFVATAGLLLLIGLARLVFS